MSRDCTVLELVFAYAARIVEPGSMIVAHEVPEWLFDFTRAVANACVCHSTTLSCIMRIEMRSILSAGLSLCRRLSFVCIASSLVDTHLKSAGCMIS